MGRPSRSEQIYSDFKARVLDTVNRPGQRVDVEALAHHYGLSTQPVRLLLNRLVGENILEVHPHEGYVVPSPTERRIRHVHLWNNQVLMLALEMAMDELPAGPFPELILDQTEIVTSTEALFEAIADLSDNDESRRAVRNMNARLRPIRRLDASAFIDTAGELAAFDAAWKEADIAVLHRLVWQYHHRRLDLIPQIMMLAYEAAAQI
jgi:DNA-binding transcriptional regulator YhcF (GntR family)